jgi:hypothetical protein
MNRKTTAETTTHDITRAATDRYALSRSRRIAAPGSTMRDN